MTNILLGEEFKRQFRRLAKKYRSLPDDLRVLKEELEKNPRLGDDLGNGKRKVRMAIASKGKGKSGGARVITYELHVSATGEVIDLVLLTIYDKSEMENISDAFIASLLTDL